MCTIMVTRNFDMVLEVVTALSDTKITLAHVKNERSILIWSNLANSLEKHAKKRV